MTQDERLLAPAGDAIECVVRNMGPNGGYGYGGPGDDVHVTCFQVMALKSGKLAKFDIPDELFEKLRNYYDNALNDDGTTGYSLTRRSGTPTSMHTSVGLFCRIFLGEDIKGDVVKKIADVVSKAGPQLEHNVFQTYYGTYSMYQMGGDYWKEWNRQYLDRVISLQIKDGEEEGSWPATEGWTTGGTVCTTAIYIMSLEVFYRYLPVNK